MNSSVNDFQFCMNKMEAFQQFLIHDKPHPLWTNYLSIDDILLISWKWKLFSNSCLNRVYKIVLQRKMKKVLNQSVMDNYLSIVDKLNQDHQKIREKAYHMERQIKMAHRNLKDKDGNTIEFPDGMQDLDAAIAYERVVVRLRTKFNKLKDNVKILLWPLIKETLTNTLGYNVEISKPVGDGKEEFVAVLSYLLKLNDEDQHESTFQALEMIIDASLSCPHNQN